MKKYFVIILLVFGVLSIFGQSEGPFVMSFSKTKVEFNPIHTYTATEAQIYTAIYEGLLSYNPITLDPMPGVARHWEILNDGTLYKFYLRSDAVYWNGDQVLASHFRDTWLKLLDPAEGAAYSSLFDVIKGAKDYRTGKTKDPRTVGIRAVSDTVLEIELEEPATHFLKVLCHHSFSPVHPSFLNIRDWSGFAAIPGNGPYYIIRKTQDELVLAKNQLYWDAKSVLLPQIRILFTDDAEKMTESFNAGEVHWIAGGMIPDKVLNKDALIIFPMFATNYYFFSSTEKGYQDERVRTALALFLPWKEIREGYPIPAHTLIPQIPSYPEVKGFQDQDVEAGFKLLAEAGFPQGIGLPDIVIKIPQGEDAERIAQLMKSAWESQLSVKVDIRRIPFAEYFDALKVRDYTIGTITWIGDFLDPLTFLQMWTKDSNLNDARFSSIEYDRLIMQSMSEYGAERYKTLQRAESIIVEGAAVLPISHSPSLNLIDMKTIGGWYPNLLDIHPFKYFRFKELELPPGVASYAPGPAVN